MAIDGNVANVVFFGDHSQAYISLENCYLYSERLQGRMPASADFKLAKKVTNEASFLYESNRKYKNVLRIGSGRAHQIDRGEIRHIHTGRHSNTIDSTNYHSTNV